MATACLREPVRAFERLERDYIAQDYELPPGRKTPTPAARVASASAQDLESFYGGRVREVLSHPRFRLHIVTARGRHVLGREHRIGTPLGYLGAFLSNALHRKAMGAWLERVVFSAPEHGRACPLPFGTDDFPTRQVRADRSQLPAGAAGELLHPLRAAGGARHPRRAARAPTGTAASPTTTCT